jgi:hypothetical protein
MKKPFDGWENVGTERRRGLGKLQRLGHPMQQVYSSFNTFLTMPKGGWVDFSLCTQHAISADFRFLLRIFVLSVYPPIQMKNHSVSPREDAASRRRIDLDD